MAKSSFDKSLFELVRSKNAWAYAAFTMYVIGFGCLLLDWTASFRSWPWTSIAVLLGALFWFVAIQVDRRRTLATGKAEAKAMLKDMKGVGRGKK